jgi:N-acetyltransferase 10
MSLLAYDSFKKFDSSTSLSVIDATSPRSLSSASTVVNRTITSEELSSLITPFDTKRLTSYADNMVEYHVILDLVPTLAALYFGKKLGEECTLSAAQQAILLALGLQRKPVEALEVRPFLLARGQTKLT